MASVKIEVTVGASTYEVTKVVPIRTTYADRDEPKQPAIRALNAAVRDIKAAITAGEAG
ncbi:hypothetical protein [Herbiconiux sp. YIM B11900]|uniref:hypothetical protein n=1 Tax=Herbiconiux sp. YIM B11900 TaxID=3404131 RepID=UPI003F8364A5